MRLKSNGDQATSRERRREKGKRGRRVARRQRRRLPREVLWRGVALAVFGTALWALMVLVRRPGMPVANWVGALQMRAGLAIAVFVLVVGAGAYARHYRPEMLEWGRKSLSFAFLTLALVAGAAYCEASGRSALWIPLPFTVMVMCLVCDRRFGLCVALFHSLLIRLVCPGSETEFLVLLIGGLAAALLCGQVRTRSTLVKVGLVTGGVQFCAMWALGLLDALAAGRPTTVQALGNDWLMAVANGVVSGFVVGGLLPAIERMFDVTTDVRLLEWSDPNPPLLQKLLVEAPGTYHHSMLVGSLSADAAESINANALLARVSSYFHDVGKLRKPEYFSENIPPGAENPHDDLSPSMSSLILTAHPKDGADMAEEYGVPKVVRDIILQSHGSSVLKYFWNKAREGADGHSGPEERDFRYRMPKPASKEAAIVMLCDAVESATRSMDSPSVGQLRNLVRDMILDRLHDGQLDESGLTITDLKRLEEGLVHGLAAVFHNRISYPGQDRADRTEEPASWTERGPAQPGEDIASSEGHPPRDDRGQ